MPRKKLQINATTEQREVLMQALAAGSPLNLALQRANISATTYYYWVAMYSVVVEAKSQDELEELKAEKFGVSIENIKDIALENSARKKNAIGGFIEPSAESLLQYRNNSIFRDFANKCYEIIVECNTKRATAAMTHLAIITKSTTDKRVNASGSMWFLERTYSDMFAKPSDKIREEEEKKLPVEKVQIEFVNPRKLEDQERVRDMEEQILHEQKGIGES